jgi:hypothetical protein
MAIALSSALAEGSTAAGGPSSLRDAEGTLTRRNDRLMVLVVESASPAERHERVARLTSSLPIEFSAITAADAAPMTDWIALTLIEEADLSAIAAAVRGVAGVAFTSPVFIDRLGGEAWISPEVFVAMEPIATPAARAEAVSAVRGLLDGHVLTESYAGLPDVLHLRAATRDGDELLARVEQVRASPLVRFAEPDVAFTGLGGFVPNEPDFAFLWGHLNTGQTGGTAGIDMKTTQAWDLTTGDPSIVVVVLDTGTQQDHPDIGQLPGKDFTDAPGPGADGGPVNPCDNHGTAVSGCVSAVGNNVIGTVGAAPSGLSASARPFKSNTSPCNGSWTSFASWTVDALAWAETLGARVSCNSNIYGFTSELIAEKYAQTREAGMVHFACAGNNGSTTVAYPANLPSVRAVTALAATGSHPSWATTGVGLDFSAPGVSIYTTDRTGSDGYNSTGDYAFVSGCSFATPYSSGVASLVISAYPGLSAAQVESILFLSATDLGAAGYDTSFGWGLPNAFLAVSMAAQMNPDLDGDGEVGGSDLGLLLSNWGGPGPVGDLNLDGVVDGGDLGALLASWSDD